METRSRNTQLFNTKAAKKTKSKFSAPIGCKQKGTTHDTSNLTPEPTTSGGACTDDEELRAIYAELSDEEEAQCVPHGSKIIQCFICGEEMRKIYKLRTHLKWHENVESYDEQRLLEAPIYEMLNPQRRNIETDVIRDFLIRELKAKRHSQFYGILSEASVELHHSDSETLSEGDDEHSADVPRRSYKCNLCGITFERRYQALFHQKTVHVKSDVLPIGCDYCGCRFMGVQLLVHHLKTQCESDEQPTTCQERFRQYLLEVNLEYFKCLEQARVELKVHRLTTARRVYTCTICQKTFLRSEHLTRHKSVHLPDELKMKCPVCFRKFNRKDNLRNHMQIHVNEAERDTSNNQQILCQLCGHCFTSRSNYIVHMRRRHTGEKPYTCETCGRGFTTNSELNSHRVSHTNESDFVCSICQKAFTRAALLDKHMRSHIGAYNCTYCTQTFQQPNALAKHLLSHCNEGKDALKNSARGSNLNTEELLVSYQNQANNGY